MKPRDDCPETPVSFAYRALRLLRVAVAVLVGLVTVAATLGLV